MATCSRKLPPVTIIAFILIFIGSGVMCGCFFHAVSVTDSFFRAHFFPVEELIYIRIAGICLAGIAILFASIILYFAILATGATKDSIYRGDYCILGGKTTGALFVGWTYFLNIFWLGMASSLVIPVLACFILSLVCHYELTYWRGGLESPNPQTFHYIFNLTYYGIYVKPYLYDVEKMNYRETITNVSDFIQMCDQASDISPLYSATFGSSVVVYLGFGLLMCTIAGYYSKLKLTRELTEFKEILDIQNVRSKPQYVYEQSVTNTTTAGFRTPKMSEF